MKRFESPWSRAKPSTPKYSDIRIDWLLVVAPANVSSNGSASARPFRATPDCTAVVDSGLGEDAQLVTAHWSAKQGSRRLDWRQDERKREGTAAVVDKSMRTDRLDVVAHDQHWFRVSGALA